MRLDLFLCLPKKQIKAKGSVYAARFNNLIRALCSLRVIAIIIHLFGSLALAAFRNLAVDSGAYSLVTNGMKLKNIV